MPVPDHPESTLERLMKDKFEAACKKLHVDHTRNLHEQRKQLVEEYRLTMEDPESLDWLCDQIVAVQRDAEDKLTREMQATFNRITTRPDGSGARITVSQETEQYSFLTETSSPDPKKRYRSPYMSPTWSKDDDERLRSESTTSFRAFDYPRRIESLRNFHEQAFEAETKLIEDLYTTPEQYRYIKLLNHKLEMEALLRAGQERLRAEWSARSAEHYIYDRASSSASSSSARRGAGSGKDGSRKPYVRQQTARRSPLSAQGKPGRRSDSGVEFWTQLKRPRDTQLEARSSTPTLTRPVYQLWTPSPAFDKSMPPAPKTKSATPEPDSSWEEKTYVPSRYPSPTPPSYESNYNRGRGSVSVDSIMSTESDIEDDDEEETGGTRPKGWAHWEDRTSHYFAGHVRSLLSSP